MKIKDFKIKPWFDKNVKDWQWAVLCYECDLEIVDETEKAVKINVRPHDFFLESKKPEGYDMWFPKSAIIIMED